jgi:hypothetical protein
MGKKKQNLVKIVAPDEVTDKAPMVISFAYWRPEDLPRPVTIEVVEVDRGDGDDMNSAEDVIARFSGTLQAAADDTARLDAPTLVTATSPSRSPDRVWVRFADQPDNQAVEAGIPFSEAIAAKRKKDAGKPAEFIANEGAFYEVAVRVRDGGAEGPELAMSAVAAVRQRSFLLLAVEPLSQNDAGMNHPAGKKILSTFHPGQESEFRPRNWDGAVLRLRGHSPMVMGDSGCSYAIMTMVLRYLRVDAPPAPVEPGAEAIAPTDQTAGSTVRLFDLHVVPDELEKEPDCKPRFFKGTPFNSEDIVKVPAQRWEAEREAFLLHFLAAAEAAGEAKSKSAKKKLTKQLLAFYDAQTNGRGDFVRAPAPSEENIDETPFYHPISKAVGDNDFVPLLIWRLHVLDGRKESYAMRRTPLSQQRLLLQGPSDYRTLAHGQHEAWVPAYETIDLEKDGKRLELLDHMTAGAPGVAAEHEGGILIPLSGTFAKTFGLVETAPHLDANAYPDDQPGDPDMAPWQRFVVATLERGLPVVGLFSPGQYSTRDTGGHFILIVGYRFLTDPDDPTKKRVRFILNDPAGGETLQYEGHDEIELNPPGVDPGDPLREEDKKRKKGKAMDRERCGLNLVIDRRKRLSLREIRVYEPGSKKASSWDAARHARFLWFRGRVKDAGDA